MSVVYVAGFHRAQVGGPYFQWDSSDDDTRLETFATENGLSATVDQSNSPPVLHWSAPGYSGSLELQSGVLVSITPGLADTSNNISFTVTAESMMPGEWKSDQYGRPFTLTDLLAEG